MFNITDTEKLRDAYIFLTFAQNAPAAAPEKKANREIFITNTKREIREYNNRQHAHYKRRLRWTP